MHVHEHEHELKITPWLRANAICAKTRGVQVEEGASFDLKTPFYSGRKCMLLTGSALCMSVHVLGSVLGGFPQMSPPDDL